MSERDEAFAAHVKIAKDRYDLKTLEYSKEGWNIESSIFVGDNRIGAKRKVIKQTERDEIIDTLQDVISKELHVSFENWSTFWATE